MKYNLSYYSHEINSHNHAKFKTLRAKYGWSGEGRFWAINNVVAEAENCKLNVSKKYVKGPLACDLGFTIEEFDEFLKFLVEDCELFFYDGECITNDHLQEDLERVMSDREEARRRYETRKNKTSGENSKTSGEKGQTSTSLGRKNIESRVEKSRVDNNKEVVEEEGAPTQAKCLEEEDLPLPPVSDSTPELSEDEVFINSLFMRYFSRPPNLGDSEIALKLLLEFGRDAFKEAFIKAREIKGNQINLGYIRGTLYKTGEKKENEQASSNSSKQQSSFNSRLNPTVSADEFSQSARAYKERYG
jgi:hypothetical protein